MPVEPPSPALFLSAETPYPLAGGGALRSASILNYLARTREVDMIVFRQPGMPDPASRMPAGLARRIVAIDLPPNGRGIAARGFRNLGRLAREAPPLLDRFTGFGGPIEAAIAGRRYGIGVVEHFWCAPYWEQISRACDRTVLDLHNVESALHARCAQTEPGVAGFAHRMFRQPCLELERVWLPRYSCVLAASEDDARAARAIAPAARVEVYPNAIPATARPPRLEEDAVVFSGNMEYHPNISAVRFFRREIWPRLRDRWPALVWRLVGKNPEGIKEYVSGDGRIEICGPVEDAVLELARAKVAVVPVLAGSGTRVKILEAWAAGTPVVSTSMGAEGLPAVPGVNILLADTASAFAEAVSSLLTQPRLAGRLGMAGRDLFEKELTWESAWAKLRLFMCGDG
ncbi:MAG: glycosyltransferase family 4 protein [Bryobacteraceae bacterium]